MALAIEDKGKLRDGYAAFLQSPFLTQEGRGFLELLKLGSFIVLPRRYSSLCPGAVFYAWRARRPGEDLLKAYDKPVSA